MEILTLGLFCAALLLCIAMGWSILIALASGLVLFLLYGRRKGFAWKELGVMCFHGVKTVRNILITFMLIGMLTALWRDAGTIPAIVCYATRLIRPSLFLAMVFLLNCMVSILTGTAFGTAATMGVICATIAATLQVDLVLVGGAVLSGIYVGDRCSPVSTSALLVAELTGTSIFQNIRRMLRSAALPFAVTCIIYLLIGMLGRSGGEIPDLFTVFGREFTIHWVAIVPALVVLVLSMFQVNVKAAMTMSILSALPISVVLQHTDPGSLPALLLNGFHSSDPQVAALIDGGGIFSMLKVTAIVCLSSSYSDIFRQTGLLDRVKALIHAFSRRTTPFAAMLMTSAAAGIVACNQTLTIMLTHQLCGELEDDPSRLALDLEDTAVVVAPMVPWSIAGAVPLASVGAPSVSILFAFFIFLLPLWRLILSVLEKRKR